MRRVETDPGAGGCVESSGPLRGLRVIELAGIGPAQLGCMMLADLGAEVVKVDRPERVGDVPTGPNPELLSRGRRSVAIDLKQERGRDLVLALLAGADALVDPFRPGVIERLGLAPESLRETFPALIVARMTGWGQDGPLAQTAGHDINYIGVAGALWPIGAADSPPPPPLNLVGDFGGGAMLMVVGVLAAIHERATSGRGQVVDAAMVDGVATLMTSIFQLAAMGKWTDRREAHWLQGAAPWYASYATADGEYVTVGPLEGNFYVSLLTALGLEPEEWPQWDEDRWPALRRELTRIFAAETATRWRARLEGSDVCFGPALRPSEASSHPHLAARETYVEREGIVQPAPSPRFDRTPGTLSGGPAWPGEHTRAILADLGHGEAAIDDLLATGVVAAPKSNRRTREHP
jgi:alpha-methylacyl-CoA racemase